MQLHPLFCLNWLISSFTFTNCASYLASVYKTDNYREWEAPAAHSNETTHTVTQWQMQKGPTAKNWGVSQRQASTDLKRDGI